MQKEKVLVFKLPKFKEDRYRVAFVTELVKSIKEDFNFNKTLMDRLVFEDRDKVEHNLDYVQINYQTLICKRVKDKLLVFTNEKIQGSTEKRLLNMLNTFAGGHCNLNDLSEDENILTTLKNNRDRELKEEVAMSRLISDGKLLYTDVIYTMESEVSKYHSCIYDVVLMPEDTDAEIVEKHKLLGEFREVEDLLNSNRLDIWSRIAIEKLKAKFEIGGTN